MDYFQRPRQHFRRGKSQWRSSTKKTKPNWTNLCCSRIPITTTYWNYWARCTCARAKYKKPTKMYSRLPESFWQNFQNLLYLDEDPFRIRNCKRRQSILFIPKHKSPNGYCNWKPTPKRAPRNTCAWGMRGIIFRGTAVRGLCWNIFRWTKPTRIIILPTVTLTRLFWPRVWRITAKPFFVYLSREPAEAYYGMALVYYAQRNAEEYIRVADAYDKYRNTEFYHSSICETLRKPPRTERPCGINEKLETGTQLGARERWRVSHSQFSILNYPFSIQSVIYRNRSCLFFFARSDDVIIHTR